MLLDLIIFSAGLVIGGLAMAYRIWTVIQKEEKNERTADTRQ